MKRIKAHLLAAVICTASFILLSGCSSTRIKRLSGTEFIAQAQGIGMIHTMQSKTYIGCSHKRAYLEFGQLSLLYNVIGQPTHTTVYWTELSELPDDIVAQLKAGNPLWKPWFSFIILLGIEGVNTNIILKK